MFADYGLCQTCVVSRARPPTSGYVVLRYSLVSTAQAPRSGTVTCGSIWCMHDGTRYNSGAKSSSGNTMQHEYAGTPRPLVRNSAACSPRALPIPSQRRVAEPGPEHRSPIKAPSRRYCQSTLVFRNNVEHRTHPVPAQVKSNCAGQQRRVSTTNSHGRRLLRY